VRGPPDAPPPPPSPPDHRATVGLTAWDDMGPLPLLWPPGETHGNSALPTATNPVAALYEALVASIIRPPRAQYALHVLGPHRQAPGRLGPGHLGSRIVIRSFRGLKITVSCFVPDDHAEWTPRQLLACATSR